MGKDYKIMEGYREYFGDLLFSNATQGNISKLDII